MSQTFFELGHYALQCSLFFHLDSSSYFLNKGEHNVLILWFRSKGLGSQGAQTCAPQLFSFNIPIRKWWPDWLSPAVGWDSDHQWGLDSPGAWIFDWVRSDIGQVLWKWCHQGLSPGHWLGFPSVRPHTTRLDGSKSEEKQEIRLWKHFVKVRTALPTIINIQEFTGVTFMLKHVDLDYNLGNTTKAGTQKTKQDIYGSNFNIYLQL